MFLFTPSSQRPAPHPLAPILAHCDRDPSPLRCQLNDHTGISPVTCGGHFVQPLSLLAAYATPSPRQVLHSIKRCDQTRECTRRGMAFMHAIEIQALLSRCKKSATNFMVQTRPVRSLLDSQHHLDLSVCLLLRACMPSTSVSNL